MHMRTAAVSSLAILVLALSACGEKKSAAPPPALTPAKAAPPAKPKEPEKPVDPEEAAWSAATTEPARELFLRERLPAASATDDGARKLHDFLAGKGRKDLARRAIEGRAEADPENPWARGLLGQVDFRDRIKKSLDGFEGPRAKHEAAERLRVRLEQQKGWIPAEDKAAVEADLEALAAFRKRMSDPWQAEAMEVERSVRDAAAYREFLPIETMADPPYVLMAQKQKDEMRQNTGVVLDRHMKFFRCLTREFVKKMGEAGLPTPTVAEMGNPVLKAFVFTDRSQFERWHGTDTAWLAGTRAYYAWGGTQFMMMYDTGASAGVQDSDTVVAFHEATHQLVHYYRRHYLWLEDRKQNPTAPEPDLRDPRLASESHFFGEGFAEFFGGVERISTATGEYKMFQLLRNRIQEWGNPLVRTSPQWTTREVLSMPGKMQMEMMAAQKWPERKEEMQSLYYAQAWNLNHYLYFGKNGRYRSRYLRYIAEEMKSQGGFQAFLTTMNAGDDEEAREAFLARLDREATEYQKSNFLEINTDR